MSIYHITVRNYHWAHQNTVVQCPVPNLDSPVEDLIVRPLEGVNRNEPRIISSVSALNDDIFEGEYQAEAHGAFISTDPENIDHYPVWATVHGHECGKDEIYVANLTAFKASSIPIAHICWVPCLEAPDGNLYTIIGAPRQTFGTTRVPTIIQPLGFPKESRLALRDPVELDSYKQIGDDRKRNLFEVQRTAMRRNRRPSPLLLNAFRVFSSPYRLDHGRLTLRDIIERDHGSPRSYGSDSSSQTLSDSSDDDDFIYTRPAYASIVDARSRPYKCDCRYAALRPTCFNPRPSHRHVTDNECCLGSSHIKHCIYADHAPTQCLVSSSKEQHRHCIPIPLWQKLQSQFDVSCGESTCLEDDVVFREPDVATNDALSPMEFEPTIADVSFVDAQV
ncbi:uncharacterized protein F4812DRAFT_463525 [Daldinia caldariorum]|uniref:uncharacterized protein n=1 Tax=Daldinia caldariorum TaxID=326644 RepID=UPI0020074BBF|nr:uncharacterized protein F4812DRAFT_463525 [Daldinia caldariorum]KAI1463697.1 hypothetical protein F4812DRAFT_463525 [Daldinia caldariorum]